MRVALQLEAYADQLFGLWPTDMKDTLTELYNKAYKEGFNDGVEAEREANHILLMEEEE